MPLLYYGFPGISQLHSPFRWVFALTLCVAVLAGFGLDDLLSGVAAKWARRVGIALLALGVLTGAGLLLSRIVYPQIEPALFSLWQGLAEAPEGLPVTRGCSSACSSSMCSFWRSCWSARGGVCVGRKAPQLRTED